MTIKFREIQKWNIFRVINVAYERLKKIFKISNIVWVRHSVDRFKWRLLLLYVFIAAICLTAGCPGFEKRSI